MAGHRNAIALGRAAQAMSVAVIVALVALSSIFGAPVAGAGDQPTLEAGASADLGGATALTLRLPARVAAVEGRVLLDPSAELVGVAPLGDGQTLAPVAVKGGFAFAAYGLGTVLGATVLRLVIAGTDEGILSARVVIDAAAGASGARIQLPRTELTASLQVGHGKRPMAAPPGLARHAPARAGGPARDLFPDGVISNDDLDTFRSAWYTARTAGDQCADSADNAAADANGDGCIDVVDIQALLAAQGQQRAAPAHPRHQIGLGPLGVPLAALAGPRLATTDSISAIANTFSVTSTADTPDASQGNGVCADSQGRCTLRAAIMESNWQAGDQRINFNLPGAAPVTITLGSALPNIGSSTSRIYIDGYSEPGSQPNTAATGTNAIPGVEVRGTGVTFDHVIYIPSAGNTIRGLLIDNSYRGIMIDTTAGASNYIIGNWIGFNRDNSLPARGYAGVMLNNGARTNFIGTSALADRNVIGNFDKGIFSYGTGTNGNVIQNNVVCIRPNGLGALCQIAIDHDFGPKDGLIGGTGLHEGNVTGPTCCNGIEYSHGWDPNGPPNNYSSTWAVSGHRAIGNWIGFRADGSYDPAFRSAQNVPEVDNGQAVNMHDGAVNITLDSNYIAAAYDGVTMQLSGTTGNTVTNNIIGQSPLGEPVPMAGWGIYARDHTSFNTIVGNVIHNTANGGIGLLEYNVRNVRISQNIVTDTSGPAIYLAPNPNNPLDGANGLMPPPTILVSTETGVSGTGISGSTVEMFRVSRQVGASGLPAQYLGSAIVTTLGTWSLTYAQPLVTGQRVAGTQTRSNGETSQFGTNVFAGGPPAAPSGDFTWTQAPGTLDVNFTATATGDPYAWSWSFGDGGTSSRQNPSWTYGAGATYSVSLTVTNESGSQTTTKSVSVAPIPPGTVLASDSFTRMTGSEWGLADTGGPYTTDGTAANFNVNGGTGNIVLPSNGATRGVRLDDVNVRDVDIRVRVRTDKMPTGTNGQLLAYLVTRSNGTSAYRPKIIAFTDGTVMVHSGVMVNGSESSMGNGVTVPGLTYAANKFIWLRALVTGVNPTTVRVKAWADGTTEPASWQFTATNSAPALQVAGGVGLHTYMSSTNAPMTFSFDDFSAVIPGGSGTAPVANFTSSQRSGTLIVDFTDTSTGTPTAWSWTFGDGTTSTQRNPTKTYSAGGNYNVTLTASNANGSNSITKTVSVAALPPPPPPTANFSASQRSGTLTVDFTDTSSGTPTSWNWTFGDNTSSTQQNPTKTYAVAGDYSVTLTATNAGGSNSVTQTVTVAPIPPPPPPTANFNSTQRVNTLTVDFTDASTGAPSAWTWDFGDGTSSTLQSPTKTYAAAGDYSVTLTASNAGGANSVTKTVSVVPIPATTTVVADAFGRTTNNGWGNADTGGSYNLLGPASNFSVGGGVGTMVVPTASTTRSAMLPATAADTDTTFRVRVNKVPAGGSYFVYAASRVNGSSEYRPRILINPNGTVSAHASVLVNGSESPIGSAVVVPGLTPAANGWIRFRAQVTGANPTTIRVKAWADGSAEPAAWNYTATNTTAALQGSGSLGLRVYVNTSVTNAPVTFGFDDYGVTTPTPPPTGSVTVLAAGDVAGCTSSGDEATAALLGANSGTIIIPGDIAYENGSTADFANCFDPSWGPYKSRMKPVPGNHEYQTPDATGYYGYFGSAAGDPAKGYYVYNLGAWRVYALNSNCFAIGGCGAGSPEEQWLRADLAANPTSCVAAYWHHPLFSSGEHGSDTLTQALFQALYDANADLVLVGHDHDYERFAPQTATGAADVTRGIRQLVVGTGGVSHYPFAGTFAANSQVHSDDTYGLLKLTLSPGAYSWQFLPVAGQSFTDAGSTNCH